MIRIFEVRVHILPLQFQIFQIQIIPTINFVRGKMSDLQRKNWF